MDEGPRQLGSPRALGVAVVVASLLACRPASGDSPDLSVVSLFNGERGELLNNWGGAWEAGTTRRVGIEEKIVLAGRRALFLELGNVEAGQSRHAQCFASGFGRTRAYYQTRDLTRFRQLRFHSFNATGVALRGLLQVKDYRDSHDHRALYRFDLPAGGGWTQVEAPLAFDAAGWTMEGKPDLTRVLTIDFVFEPRSHLASGRIYLDEVTLVEPDGPIDINTSPLPLLVERLAHRQWDGLWAARDRGHGMVPNTSYQVTDAGLNTTATVLWMLPAAVRRNWVKKAEADQYVQLLLQTINRLLDRAQCVPPRYVDWVTLEPSLLPEESSVDAAFLALALYQYQASPSTSAELRQAIDQTRNRFNFAAFSSPTGWRMAYRYRSAHTREGFPDFTYNGYTNEGNLVSLAAHLSERHHVPIETHWNRSVYRVRGHLTAGGPAPVVHLLKEFRAPFTQALLNLFVDVRERGADTYPDGQLAVNPWQNFVCYEQNVMTRLAETGRPYLVQPDAGDDGTLANYQQFSVYETFGQGDLFMPWSIAFCLLAGADRAEESLRHLLRSRLHGPLGLSDSARWATGASAPYAVASRQDFWSTGLSTMAFLEWLDGDCRLSRSFTAIPDVRKGLDRVFPSAAVVSVESSKTPARSSSP